MSSSTRETYVYVCVLLTPISSSTLSAFEASVAPSSWHFILPALALPERSASTTRERMRASKAVCKFRLIQLCGGPKSVGICMRCMLVHLDAKSAILASRCVPVVSYKHYLHANYVCGAVCVRHVVVVGVSSYACARAGVWGAAPGPNSYAQCKQASGKLAHTWIEHQTQAPLLYVYSSMWRAPS